MFILGGVFVVIDGIDMFCVFVVVVEGEIEVMVGSGVDVVSVLKFVVVGVDVIYFFVKCVVIEDGGVCMGLVFDGVGGYEVIDCDIVFVICDVLVW